MLFTTKKTGLIETLKRKGLSHTLSYTGSTSYLKTKNSKGKTIQLMTGPAPLPKSDLRYIRLIRLYMKKHFSGYKKNDQLNPSDIQYIVTDPRKFETYYTDNNGNRKPWFFMEVDVSGAYHQMLKIMGFFDKKGGDKLYKMGINLLPDQQPEYYKEGEQWKAKYKRVTKTGRLISAGSLARTKTHYEYNPQTGKYPAEPNRVEHDEDLANIFYDMCLNFGLVMREAMNQQSDKIAFFWTDALIFRGRNFCELVDTAEKVKSFLADQGFESKIEYLANSRFTRNKRGIYFFETRQARNFEKWKDKGCQDREKEFILPGKKNRIREERINILQTT